MSISSHLCIEILHFHGVKKSKALREWEARLLLEYSLNLNVTSLLTAVRNSHDLGWPYAEPDWTKEL